MVGRREIELNQNLPGLQNVMKRDPQSYEQEFKLQWAHFEALLRIFDSSTDEDPEFASTVSTCYPLLSKELPSMLINLLKTNLDTISPDLRRTLVNALILLRNKNLVDTQSLLSLFFTLFRCHDKQLRSLLHSHIVSDIKNLNQKHKNNKLNSVFQNFMYKMLNDDNEIAARKSLEVMVDLYKKNVWNDQKTVNVIAEACFSKNLKVVSTAVHFFLGADDKVEEEESEDEIDINNIKHVMSITKKTKAKRNQLGNALKQSKRKQRQKEKSETFNFSALHLINDPQGFTEKLFKKLKHAQNQISHKFELRLQILNLLTRMIGIHKLILFNLYEFLLSYIKPAQRDVTKILAYTAQASHDLIPPDAMSPVVQAIADNFIWSNCSPEVVCAGLNSLREICVRCPLAMPESLLQSLVVDYKHHRERGVMAAARSLVGLFREVNPEMLKKKDRGKVASMNVKNIVVPRYGGVKVFDGIEGLEEMMVSKKRKLESANEKEEDWEDEEGDEIDEGAEKGDGWEGWEEASLDSGDEEVLQEEEEEEENDESTTKELNGGDGESLEPKPAMYSNVAMEKILTEKDFKKIRSINLQRDAARRSGKKGAELENIELDSESDDDNMLDDEDNGPSDVVDVDDIIGSIKRKRDYDSRIESIKAGREGREKFGSKKSKEERSSKTNKEKSKKKNNMMMVHKKSVKGKSQRSLRDKQKILRAHINKQKKKL